MSFEQAVLLAAISVWLGFCLYLSRWRRLPGDDTNPFDDNPFANPPEVYRYRVVAEYKSADGVITRSESSEPVTITIPRPIHAGDFHIYRGKKR